MSATVSGNDFPLSAEQVESLWQAAVAVMAARDMPVVIRCVGEDEMKELNFTYRGKDRPTNVLTFSYRAEGPFEPESEENDIVLCLPVAEQEARVYQVLYPNYVALLLAHAFLHVLGMDHEKSSQEDTHMRAKEQQILQACGFPSLSLGDIYLDQE